MYWLKRFYAKDRWTILRITHWAWNERPGIRESKIHCKNRYSGKLAVFTHSGEWYIQDFPNKSYTG